VEQIVEFLETMIGVWPTAIRSPANQCVFAFLVLLLVLDIARKGWRLSWSRLAVRSVAATIAIFNINLILAPAIWLLSDQIKALYALAGIPSIPTSAWSAFPVWALMLVAIVAHDFANYWNHRLMHMKWLWPVHAIHHSDPHVNALTAYRIHALETLVMWVSYTILLTWLGLPADAIGMGAVILVLHTIYVHVDVDWDHGPFRLLIASPRFHRWHHANAPEAYGKNLANVFPFFDRVFGTYHVPGPCTAAMGADNVPQNDVVRLTLWPALEWTRLTLEQIGIARRRIGSMSGRDAALPGSGMAKVDID
jgi:sterol desaturase/sphingolipid hydroxylase (fatty acid hydroxylase superfamily)